MTIKNNDNQGKWCTNLSKQKLRRFWLEYSRKLCRDGLKSNIVFKFEGQNTKLTVRMSELEKDHI